MKKWTVMLIPHDRTSSRTLTMTAAHVWVPLACLLILTFAAAFLFQRERGLSARYRALETESVRSAFSETDTLTADQVRELEKLRSENSDLRSKAESLEQKSEEDRTAYRESIETVTARLNEVLEVETQVRNLTGLAPHSPAKQQDFTGMGGGKGGPPGAVGDVVLSRRTDQMRPPHVIYGMSSPSADLIIQEIEVRSGSLHELLRDIEAQRDEIDRMPSIWPVAGRSGKLTSTFGYRKDPFTRRVRHHQGVDIAAQTGTRVLAAAKGKVLEAGYDGYYGYVVKIDHGNGLHTWYAHLSQCLVKAGENVKRSQVVGAVGSTGRSTGPHLHYEVHKNGSPVDAAQYLGR